MDDSAQKPLMADLRQELADLLGEMREMASARWELARLELQNDLRCAKRLAVAWLLAAVASLTALPALVVSLAEVLDGCGNIARAGWLLIFGLGLLSAAAATAYLAWRSFGRRFLGLRETLEEIREDLLWLHEYNTNPKRERGRD